MENERGQFSDCGKECIHHWLIDEMNFGVCKKYGASRRFCNSWGKVQKAWYARPSKAHHDIPDTKS